MANMMYITSLISIQIFNCFLHIIIATESQTFIFILNLFSFKVYTLKMHLSHPLWKDIADISPMSPLAEDAVS